MNKTVRSTRGFTLIELLLVVVVIGIVAALVMTKFGDVKDRTYVSAMQNDLRNLAASQEIFSDEVGAYASDPGAIPGFSLSKDVAMINHTSVGSVGWSALVGHASTDRTCFLSRFPGDVHRILCGEGDFGVSASNSKPQAGDEVTFTVTESGDVLQAGFLPFALASASAEPEVTWNFGDGTVLVGGTTESHTFTESGTYAVIAVSKADGGVARASGARVVVGSPGTASPPASQVFDLTYKGAVVVAGDVRLGPGDLIAIDGVSVPGIIRNPGSDRTDFGSSVGVSGSPSELLTTVTPGWLLSFGDYSWADLAGAADYVHPGGGVSPGTFTGLSSDAIVYVETAVTFETGVSGQGLLLVNGDLMIQGGFTWDGPVIVNGNFNHSGSSPSTINGSLQINNDPSDLALIRGHIQINYAPFTLNP